jgi:hypothetical protein
VNVGVLLFFPEYNAFEFVYPSHLQRLKALFPELDTRSIQAYLKQIMHNASVAPKLPHATLSEIIDQHILKADDSSLQFSELATCLSYTQDTEKIVKDFYAEYLSAYDPQGNTTKRFDDAFLKHTFYKRIKERADLFVKFERNYTIETSTIPISFDFAWQNGSLNLIKSASFDLKEAGSIQDKAIGIYGSLNLLRETPIAHKLHFDLLIAEPTQKGLSSSFDNGLKTIEKADVSLNFVYKDKIIEYADHALAYLDKD